MNQQDRYQQDRYMRHQMPPQGQMQHHQHQQAQHHHQQPHHQQQVQHQPLQHQQQQHQMQVQHQPMQQQQILQHQHDSPQQIQIHQQQIHHQPQQQQVMQHHSYDARPSTSASQIMSYPPQTSQHIQLQQPQQQPQRVMQQRTSLSSQLPSLGQSSIPTMPTQASASVSAPPSASPMGPPPVPTPGPSMHRSTTQIAPQMSEPTTPATLKRQLEDQAMMPPPKRKMVKRDVPPSHRIHEYEKALDLTGFIKQLEHLLQQPIKIPGTQVPAGPGSQRVRYSIFSIKGIYASEEERLAEVSKFYNTKTVGCRKWLLKQMTDESDSDSDGERNFTLEDIRMLLKIHKRRRSIQRGYLSNPLNAQYTYYGAGLISAEDRFPEHQASVLRQHGQLPPAPPGGESSMSK
ncbi:hypothetical protein QR680_015115 [Steinernema hermaphroditum]|uniref:Uncharacterized protein n=1 Tax=Steinernema hermaphroditum TaxID=289476 RepID=A0AA39IDT0_9BILA|nr:hypothetical protein QR680_015115 [Steinernema hermaphroditum]